MDQKIKDFDRRIEQMMNENAVAPPFGMWNRISADLDAEALPIATPPASAIPGRAMVGMFAGALILGATLVTAYLVNNTKERVAINIAAKEIPAKNISVERNIQPVMVLKTEKP